MWTIRTMLLGIISLMLDNNERGIGFMNTNNDMKKKYAKASLAYNMKNQQFVELFKAKFQDIGVDIEELAKNSVEIKEQLLNESRRKIPEEFNFFNVIQLGNEREQIG